MLCYLFFPYAWLPRSDSGSQEPAASVDYYYYPEGAYYYVETADGQE